MEISFQFVILKKDSPMADEEYKTALNNFTIRLARTFDSDAKGVLDVMGVAWHAYTQHPGLYPSLYIDVFILPQDETTPRRKWTERDKTVFEYIGVNPDPELVTKIKEFIEGFRVKNDLENKDYYEYYGRFQFLFYYPEKKFIEYAKNLKLPIDKR